MRLIPEVIMISHAKFHCNRLTVQDIQDYMSLIFWDILGHFTVQISPSLGGIAEWNSCIACVVSVFVRDSTDCKLLVACQQFRTRDCTLLDIALFCTTKPIIESSTTVRLACYQYSYPQLAGALSWLTCHANCCVSFATGWKSHNVFVTYFLP